MNIQLSVLEAKVSSGEPAFRAWPSGREQGGAKHTAPASGRRLSWLHEEVLPEEGKCVKPAALFLASSLSFFFYTNSAKAKSFLSQIYFFYFPFSFVLMKGYHPSQKSEIGFGLSSHLLHPTPNFSVCLLTRPHVSHSHCHRSGWDGYAQLTSAPSLDQGSLAFFPTS